MFGMKQRQEARAAKRDYDVAVLESIRIENELRLRELQGPGFCPRCAEREADERAMKMSTS